MTRRKTTTNNDQVARMDVPALVQQLNVLTAVVAENIQLKAELQRAHQLINEQQKLLAECKAEDPAEEEGVNDER